MDPSLVDRDALVEKVGKNKATLIMAGFENVASREKARVAEVTETVNKAAGSADNWKKAAGWAVKNLPEGELAELRGMLDKGGRQAQFAAGEIIARFNDDPKNTALNAGTGQVKPDGKAGSAVKPITRRQYGEMLDKLHRTRGSEAEFAASRRSDRLASRPVSNPSNGVSTRAPQCRATKPEETYQIGGYYAPDFPSR